MIYIYISSIFISISSISISSVCIYISLYVRLYIHIFLFLMYLCHLVLTISLSICDWISSFEYNMTVSIFVIEYNTFTFFMFMDHSEFISAIFFWCYLLVKLNFILFLYVLFSFYRFILNFRQSYLYFHIPYI